MALIKVNATGSARAEIIQACNVFRAHIVDVSLKSVIIEATGSEDKLSSLIRFLEPFGGRRHGFAALCALFGAVRNP